MDLEIKALEELEAALHSVDVINLYNFTAITTLIQLINDEGILKEPFTALEIAEAIKIAVTNDKKYTEKHILAAQEIIDRLKKI